MKGTAGIPALELVTLNKLITKFDKAPSMFFSNLFPTQQYPSDAIKWEIEYGSAGMTPFVAPGSIAPVVGMDGVGEASAKAAYWKEKMYFDEEFLNNMREPGTWATYQTAERKLSRGVKKLKYRVDRRREWMLCRMLIDGALSYTQKGGTKFNISYGVPATHTVTLQGNFKWDGTTPAPVTDIFEGKKIISEDSMAQVNHAVLNSELLKVLILNTEIQGLLKKSAFGEGDLFQDPARVIGTLMGVGPLTVYDEMFEVTGWLTTAVVPNGGADYVIYVDDASDFEVGGTARFVDMSGVNVWEDEVIKEVDVEAGSIMLVAGPVLGFKANEDKVIMRKKFIPNNVFFMFSDIAEGEPIAEFMEAPHGLGRNWGQKADTKDQWDPEGLYLRIADKGLGVYYHPDTSYKIIATD